MPGTLSELTMRGGFRAKVAAVMADLRNHGFKPFIVDGVRTKAEAALFAKQGKGIKHSKHLPNKFDGKAEAVDIADEVHGWSNRKFFLMMASSAAAHGLKSGIYFGLALKPITKAKLAAAIKAKNWDYAGGFGNDANHLELP